MRDMKDDKPSPLPLYIGVAGAIAMAVCDVTLLGVPQAGWSADIYSFGALPLVSTVRIQAGALGGLVASFFICAGYWYLWQLLRSYASRLAFIMFGALVFYSMMGGVFHAGYYFAGSAIHRGDIILYFNYLHRLQLLAVIAGAGSLVGSLTYAYIMLRCQYTYAKWYAAGNLLVWQGLALAVTYILPAPVGGFIRPTFINLGTVLFFMYLWIMQRNSKESSRLGVG
ncbi:MAG: hypothetical protein JSS76_15930 [Bacteroidetes bacterium]|nr:hypothetical protein [Bacteroidota bacterium]